MNTPLPFRVRPPAPPSRRQPGGRGSAAPPLMQAASKGDADASLSHHLGPLKSSDRAGVKRGAAIEVAPPTRPWEGRAASDGDVAARLSRGAPPSGVTSWCGGAVQRGSCAAFGAVSGERHAVAVLLVRRSAALVSRRAARVHALLLSCGTDALRSSLLRSDPALRCQRKPRAGGCACPQCRSPPRRSRARWPAAARWPPPPARAPLRCHLLATCAAQSPFAQASMSTLRVARRAATPAAGASRPAAARLAARPARRHW